MMEQSAVVQRALDALRIVCIAEPASGGIACDNGAGHNPLNAPANHPPNPPRDLAGWFVYSARVTVFPHCPRCASYALYRNDNLDDYECQTCGFMAISEEQARRVM